MVSKMNVAERASPAGMMGQSGGLPNVGERQERADEPEGFMPRPVRVAITDGSDLTSPPGTLRRDQMTDGVEPACVLEHGPERVRHIR